jgi:hypothetical protein
VLCAGVSVPPLRGRPASARCTVRRARSEAPLRVARGDGASALAQPCRASPAYALAAMLASVAYPLTARPARRRLFGAPCADRAVQGAHHAEPRQERLAAAEVRAPCRRAVRADQCSHRAPPQHGCQDRGHGGEARGYARAQLFDRRRRSSSIICGAVDDRLGVGCRPGAAAAAAASRRLEAALIASSPAIPHPAMIPVTADAVPACGACCGVACAIGGGSRRRKRQQKRRKQGESLISRFTRERASQGNVQATWEAEQAQLPSSGNAQAAACRQKRQAKSKRASLLLASAPLGSGSWASTRC